MANLNDTDVWRLVISRGGNPSHSLYPLLDGIRHMRHHWEGGREGGRETRGGEGEGGRARERERKRGRAGRSYAMVKDQKGFLYTQHNYFRSQLAQEFHYLSEDINLCFPGS